MLKEIRDSLPIITIATIGITAVYIFLYASLTIVERYGL